MNQFLTIVLFSLSGFFAPATGADYIDEILRHVIHLSNDKTTNENTTSTQNIHADMSNARPNADSVIYKATKYQALAPLLKNSEQNTSNEVLPEILNPDLLKDYIYNTEWKLLLYRLLRIIIIISLSIFFWRVSNKAAQRYIRNVRLFKKVADHSSTSTHALIKTIAPIIKSIFHWLLIVLTLLIVLSELKIDIMPIIFSFSILGVAFTIGSQSLMKDLVNGILMLFEGNVAVGDVVTVGDKTGTVESMSLRTLLLRHFTGELQTIPLSEVTSLINCSRDFSVAIVQFVVDPKALLPNIELALRETFFAMKMDVRFGPYIAGELSDLGVKTMSEVGVLMYVSIPIKPDPRKKFLAEFNRRLYERLQQYEVPLAYARTN
ncbi:MAG: mechanosensitive ion channel domain-containing protein [Pseudomonadota bacterium]